MGSLDSRLILKGAPHMGGRTLIYILLALEEASEVER